ncbi:MAG: glycosyl hydrolase [Ignavibacteria bacterium]|nr:glycosyl hydrolase [Ignavibacteria bacterium]
MRWREIGPFRGGRSIAVAGHKDYPNTFYFGATGGGIWKSEDGGTTWLNCSDGFLKVGIVGALAIAESDPNVIYAGTGEACIRGNVMPGEGMYKSDDAGKTWKFTGLAEAQTISKIVVHPKDENLVYVAAFGHVFGANKERGVFRSNDGGKNWQKILFKNDSTGAVDIEIDPNNARIIYAALWQAYRNPWSMSSGGGGSSLWKSTNGGDTWEEISSSKGLPKGLKGKIGIAVSQAKRDRVWAIVEADEGGLFRSEDGGKNWTKINDDRRIRQRAWYYSHIYADPKNADVVYILNVQFFKSMDGGKTLQNISVPHGDNHDLWINPNEPRIMVNGNDGGACVTYNGGQSWTELDIATAQIYHVSVDSAFPYNIYGAQQDNSTIRIASRTTSFGIGTRDWYSVGGGESGFVVPNWSNPEVVYAGSYDGYLTKYDHRIDQEQNISPYPENPMGSGAKDWKYRFQWTFPILVSKYDAKVLYVTANKVFKSTNEGMSWEIISPDLTRNDTTKLDASGGPITKDNTSVEYYGTIFAFAESKAQKGILWSGSDDGLIFVSQDDGKNWNNVTPKDLPDWSMISILDASAFENGTAYVAVNRYKLDDFKPYIFKTNDFGKSWKKIVRGIPDNEFVHVVREDQNRKGLLYAGTERGMYVSFDDGEHWQTLQLNLPVVPIHDIAIQAREKDLVVATHGRSFWVLDNLTPLYQLNDDVAKSDVYLYQPRFTYPIGGGGFDRPGSTVGKNPPRGVVCYYYFKNKISEKDTVKLEFLDERDSLIKSFVCKKESESKEGSNDEETAPLDSGMNRFVWDMQYKNATDVPGAIMWGGTTQGPVAIPGKYFVRLKWNAKSWKQEFEIWKDPRVTTTQDEFKEQLDFLLKIRDTVSAAHECVNAIRDIRSQVNDLVKRMEKHKMKDSISSLAKKLNEKMKKIEEEIIQVKIKSGQDALNYPIKLNDKIASLTGVVSAADAKPTKQAYDVYNDLTSRLNEQLHKFKSVIDTDLVEFNRVVKELEIPAVIMKK